MENKKVCSVCGTENEEEYRFCKNCGAKLNTSTPEYSPTNGYAPYERNYGNPYSAPNYSERLKTIDGVETEKLSAYVGKEKRDYYMPRFIGMSVTGKKTTFNWAVAILACFVGMPFMAAWFFYRKMPKIGVFLCAVSLIFTAFSTLITFDGKCAEIKTLLEAIAADEYSYLQTDATFSELLLEYLKLGISVAVIALVSSYANYFYMKHSVSRIKLLDSDGTLKGPEFYESAGKPSLALAIVIPLIFCIADAAIMMTPLISVLSEIDSSVLLSLIGVV